MAQQQAGAVSQEELNPFKIAKQQFDRAAQHSGGGVVATGDHRECEREDRQHTADVAVGAHSSGHQM